MKQHQTPQPAFLPLSNSFNPGKFGRMFPYLPPWTNEEFDNPEQYLKIISSHPGFLFYPPNAQENSSIPAGYTYLGQFISHDISFDPTSISERSVDADFLWNYRTPAFDLDSVYGGGPSLNPYLFKDGLFFAFRSELSNSISFLDVLRINNQAVIPDIRNDENLIVSQLHVAFMSFHNKMVNRILKERNINLEKISYREKEKVFKEARQQTIWHYQFVVLNDYLPEILGEKNTIYPENFSENYSFRSTPFIPVEFSAAAFKFGHSQVREVYVFNKYVGNTTPLLPDQRPEKQFYVDWRLFFGEGLPVSEFTDKSSAFISLIEKYIDASGELVLIRASKIGPLFISPLMELRHGNQVINLATQDLLRGLKLQLPSGQTVARALALNVLDWHKLSHLFGQGRFPNSLVDEEKFKENTPLWYYIMAEALAEKGGSSLGPVGGYIIKKVFLDLIKADKGSYLNQEPDWVPQDENRFHKPDFGMVDFLQVAGVFSGAFGP